MKYDKFSVDFNHFLKFTDEKKILYTNILKETRRGNVTSVLDIGAGDGEISQLLAEHFDRYISIEKRKKYAQLLTKKGIKTITGEFPFTTAPGKFDLVLISWSLDRRINRYQPFLRRAWNKVSPKGQMIIITYRGEGDHWNKLMSSAGLSAVSNRATFPEILKCISTFGKVSKRKIVTKIKAKSSTDLIESLAFIYSFGRVKLYNSFMKKTPKIENIVNKKYKIKTGYLFPYTHQFIIVKKK